MNVGEGLSVDWKSGVWSWSFHFHVLCLVVSLLLFMCDWYIIQVMGWWGREIRVFQGLRELHGVISACSLYHVWRWGHMQIQFFSC